MSEQSKIEWTDATFNPWWGCEKVSPGCAHCYAERDSARFHPGERLWGDGHVFRFFGDPHWNEPLRWARSLPEKLGRRPRVFCASMADVFEARDELEAPRARLFDLIVATPELDWLILTKRPDVARTEMYGFEPPNVWLGTSIENARHNWRADALREIPCAVRFISAEPLLGSLYQVSGRDPVEVHPSDSRAESQAGLNGPGGSPNSRPERAPLDLDGIDWVIVGGESGPEARPMHPDWAREIREACYPLRAPDRHGNVPARVGPAFFFKQWGEWAPAEQSGVHNVKMSKHRFQYESRRFAGDGTAYKATEPDLYSYPGMASLLRVGRRRAGRKLDGRTWDEMPVPVKR